MQFFKSLCWHHKYLDLNFTFSFLILLLLLLCSCMSVASVILHNKNDSFDSHCQFNISSAAISLAASYPLQVSDAETNWNMSLLFCPKGFLSLSRLLIISFFVRTWESFIAKCAHIYTVVLFILLSLLDKLSFHLFGNLLLAYLRFSHMCFKLYAGKLAWCIKPLISLKYMWTCMSIRVSELVYFDVSVHSTRRQGV